jgi:hypothetical protein
VLIFLAHELPVLVQVVVERKEKLLLEIGLIIGGVMDRTFLRVLERKFILHDGDHLASKRKALTTLNHYTTKTRERKG